MQSLQVCSVSIKTEYSASELKTTLSELLRSGARMLRWEKGVYRFEDDTSGSDTFFDLSEFSDFTIDGQGSTFAFQGMCRPFLLKNCRNVILKNFNCVWMSSGWDAGKASTISICNSKNIYLEGLSVEQETCAPAIKIFSAEDYTHKEVPVHLIDVQVCSQNGQGVWVENQSADIVKSTFDTLAEAILLQSSSADGISLSVSDCIFSNCARDEHARAQISAIPNATEAAAYYFSDIVLIKNIFQGSKKSVLIAKKANFVQVMDNALRPITDKERFEISECNFFRRCAHLKTAVCYTVPSCGAPTGRET